SGCARAGWSGGEAGNGRAGEIGLSGRSVSVTMRAGSVGVSCWGGDTMGGRTFCDSVSRRDLLRLGTAGLFCTALTLPGLLEGQARAAAGGGPARDVSLIFLFLHGGLSTIDSLDLKPDAPAEFRGEFRPIRTSVPGVLVGEHLPRLARRVD